MRSPCTARSVSARSNPTAPIPSPAPATWNWTCNPASGSDKMSVPPYAGVSSMNKILLPTLALLVAVSPAFATEGKTVSYKSGDETVQGALYTPSGKGPFPAIIVVHEWWGLNDWVKEQASRLADQGYVALAVDLYRGKVAATPDEAHEIMRGVPEDRAKQDLDAAFTYLKSQNNVKGDRIGSIGWCMGGGYSLDVALQQPQL